MTTAPSRQTPADVFITFDTTSMPIIGEAKASRINFTKNSGFDTRVESKVASVAPRYS